MQTKIGGSSEARPGIGSGSECRSPEQWAGSSEGGIEHFFGEGAAFVLLRCFGVTGWECGSLSESTSEKEISLSRSEMRTRFAGGAGGAEGRDRRKLLRGVAGADSSSSSSESSALMLGDSRSEPVSLLRLGRRPGGIFGREGIVWRIAVSINKRSIDN